METRQLQDEENLKPPLLFTLTLLKMSIKFINIKISATLYMGKLQCYTFSTNIV